MSPVDSTQHLAGEPGDYPVAEIGKGGLLLGNVEFQIEQHLLTHGSRIAPETRWFLAQVRDALGTAFQDSLEKAREDVSANTADAKNADEAGHSLAIEVPPAETPGGKAAGDGVKGGVRRRQPASKISIVRGVTQTVASAACGALFTLLVLHEGSPSGTHDLPLNLAGGSSQANQPVETAARLAGSDADQERQSLSTVQAAGKETPEIVLTRLEARPKGAAYPGPRELAASPIVVEALDPQAIAAGEDDLDLSPRDRQQIQRRLSLAVFDPQAVDGIFGPETRAAIREWQAASGSLPTGYLEERTLAVLMLETEEDYRGWRAAQRARKAAKATRTAALATPLPPTAPESRTRCERDPSGAIVLGEGIKCDFRGLKEDISRLFSGKRLSHGVAQGERTRTSDGG